MTHEESQHEESKTGESARRWLLPATAAASVALIAAAVWGVSSVGGSQQSAHPVNQAATSSTSPPAAATRAPATAPVPLAVANAPNAAGATTQATLPAYFVGATSASGQRFGLYREFVRTAVPAGATRAQKARAAVAVAMNAQPFTGYEPYLQPWTGTSITAVTVTPTRITISLNGSGAAGFTAAQTRLAVQQLVWTAQAAVGQGAVPVSFVIKGSVKLFGAYPTSQTYNRPAPSLQYEVLAPIWITSPIRGQVIPAGASVTATGQSCAFEGTTAWQLRKGTATVRSGSTTATSGCPTRGTWQVKLGVLAAGSYTFRMYELSMQDGKTIVAETSKPFTAR